jgi:hypothetical protein
MQRPPAVYRHLPVILENVYNDLQRPQMFLECAEIVEPSVGSDLIRHAEVEASHPFHAILFY